MKGAKRFLGLVKLNFNKMKKVFKNKIIDKMGIELNPNKVMPEKWCIKDATHHLYRLGISLYPNGCNNRSIIFHPIIVFLIQIILLLKFIYSALEPGVSTNYWDYLIVGDFMYFMNAKFYLNLLASILYTISILTHLLHIIAYLMRKEPT